MALSAIVATLSTIVGPPIALNTVSQCCVYDSPFLALRVNSNTTASYTANGKSYLIGYGDSINALLPSHPPGNYTGLGPTPDSYSACGKWLNAALADEATGVVHGFFHQEWNCDYAKGLYTNKSVGYATSSDGGRTFTFAPGNSSQIIAGANFSSDHQTGEGDHGVVMVNGSQLLMLFIEWNAPHSMNGGTTISAARAPLSSNGQPGSWQKWHNGSFSSPGIGGDSSALANLPGTALAFFSAADALIAVGVIFSGPLELSWGALDGVSWQRSTAGPVFHAGNSDWNRNVNSSELFGYPALTGPYSSSSIPDVNGSVFFTYLAPGTDFNDRFLVKRSFSVLSATMANGSPAPALAALSLWTREHTSLPLAYWMTTGPVAPLSNYSLASGYSTGVALLATWAPPSPAPALLRVSECVPGTSAAFGGVALTLDGECGASGGQFAGGAELRVSGWIASSAADSSSLGWGSATLLSTGQKFEAYTGALWRCVLHVNASYALYGGEFNGPPASLCKTMGDNWAQDAQLGFALSPLQLAAA